MLSRRQLRVKVMQVLYAAEMENLKESHSLKLRLEQLLAKSEQLYYLLLVYLLETCEYVTDYAEKRKSKMLPSADDLNVSTRLATNQIVLYLKNSDEFQKFITKAKTKSFVQEDEVRNLFECLVSKEKYKSYLELNTPELEDDKAILMYILKRVVDENEDLFNSLDEEFLNLSDDFHMLVFLLQKAIEQFDPKHKQNFIFQVDADQEDLEFANDLLTLTFNNDSDLMFRISPRLRNWDPERVAVVDMILLKLALCELKFFPLIPVKVTINEYLEIAKSYSTPKSKDFLNGILDKLMHDLKSNGEIVKKGRGLLEH